jgi:hypothetical protein
VSDWKIAMVCLLPLLAIGSPVSIWGVRLPSGMKGKTWLVLFSAALAGSLFSADAIMAFLAIDALAAFFVLQRPRGETQRAIGIVFIMMMFLHLGFYAACRLQPGPHDLTRYVEWERGLGWLQWACLAFWGVGDALVRLVVDRGASRNLVADRNGG